MLEIHEYHTKDLSGKIETRRPSLDNWNTDSFTSFRHIKNRCCRSLIAFNCKVLQYFHLKQSHQQFRVEWGAMDGPHCVVAISRPLAPSTRPTSESWWAKKQKREGPLTVPFLRNQEEHRCANLFLPSQTLLHFLKEFFNTSTSVRFSSSLF